MKNHRQSRVAEFIREELAEILLGEAQNPSVRRFTVSSVEPAGDLGSARVFVTPAAGEQFKSEAELKRALKALRQAKGFLRHLLAQRGELRRVPELHFELDQGLQRADRINQLLERLRKRSKSGLGVVILASLAGLSQAQQAAPQRYEASATIMGTVYRVAVYGEDRGMMAAAVQAAFEEARRLDGVLSNYKEDSELSRINRLAADGPIEISEEMAELLAQCQEYSRASEGAFDVTVGPLMKVWGFYKGEGELPSRFTLWRTVGKIGYQNLELDRERRRVEFRRSGMELDPGGIGKGYAVDRMAEELRRFGVERAMVSAGSSSMYGLGSPPGEPRGWHVSIRDPRKPKITATEVYLRDESLSTSGSYEKFFRADGKLYSHIMDPRTGMPAEGVFSVSVVSDRTIDSEAWATAFFVNGLEWTAQHDRADFGVFACAADGSCQWVRKRPGR